MAPMHTFFLSVRALHVLLGATWLGMALLASMFVMPAIRDAGPDGGKVLAAMARRGLVAFIPSIAGLTVLSGLWLYWRFTDGFNPAVSGSAGAMVFGMGGVLGLVAAVLGGSVVGRNIKKVLKLSGEAAATSDAAAREALLRQAGQAGQKAGAAGRLVTVLLAITIVLMAIGHYV